MNADWLDRQRAQRNRANLLELKRRSVGLTDAEQRELSGIPHVLGLDAPPDAPGGIVVVPREAPDEAAFERMAAAHEAKRTREGDA
jgi:hypothetical protein